MTWQHAVLWIIVVLTIALVEVHERRTSRSPPPEREP